MADRNGYIGRAPSDSAVTVARQTFSPTGVTTNFTFASGYVAGYFDIFINGVKMIEGSDYTSTDGSTFSILNGGAISGDVIEGVAYKAFNAATATVGINSSGTPIGSVNTLNFVGTGNTFALRGSSIDISISGGGAGAGGTWTNYDTNTGVSTTKKVKIENNLEVTGVTTSTGGFVGNVTGNASGTAGGLTGTPDITVRNITGVAATFTGVLTYEDVTNVDSVGVVTARSGLRVVGGGNITSPTLAHTGSTGSGYTASLNVNASNVSASFTSQSSAGDLIYYCPSIASACQEHTFSESDSGFHSWTYYAWARGDVWWCFYRSGFRIASTSSFEVNYGVYARGHVYEHVVDSTNVFAGLVLGAITGGAYFAAAIAAAIAAGSFTSTSVDGGNYLPYENSYRNNSANAFIISKASYYD